MFILFSWPISNLHSQHRSALPRDHWKHHPPVHHHQPLLNHNPLHDRTLQHHHPLQHPLGHPRGERQHHHHHRRQQPRRSKKGAKKWTPRSHQTKVFFPGFYNLVFFLGGSVSVSVAEKEVHRKLTHKKLFYHKMCGTKNEKLMSANPRNTLTAPQWACLQMLLEVLDPRVVGTISAGPP